MASGAKVLPACSTEFELLKMGKKYRYIVFKMNEKLSEIEIDKIGKRDETYDDLKAYLLDIAEQKQCRYAVFDLDFEFKGATKNKIVFIAWSPENSKIKLKMTYTSSKDYLKKALKVVPEVQATDADELSIENVIEKAQRGMKD